jgi:hypothetical protein
MRMDTVQIEGHLRQMLPACVRSFQLSRSMPSESIDRSFKTAWTLACNCGSGTGRLHGHRLRDLNAVCPRDILVSPLAFECADCLEVTGILDTAVHGYHAEVGKIEDDIGSTKLRKIGERVTFDCPHCGHDRFVMMVEFIYWNLDLMLDEPQLSAEDFFNEFSLYCTCTKCRQASKPTDFGKL